MTITRVIPIYFEKQIITRLNLFKSIEDEKCHSIFIPNISSSFSRLADVKESWAQE